MLKKTNLSKTYLNHILNDKKTSKHLTGTWAQLQHYTQHQSHTELNYSIDGLNYPQTIESWRLHTPHERESQISIKTLDLPWRYDCAKEKEVSYIMLLPQKSYFILNVVVITFSGPNAKTDELSWLLCLHTVYMVLRQQDSQYLISGLQ